MIASRRLRIAAVLAVLAAPVARAAPGLPVNVVNTPSVNVVNTPAVTVANTPAVSVVATPEGASAWQQQVAVADSSACGPTCTFSFQPVPAGHRLVITYLYAQVEASATAVGLTAIGGGSLVNVAVPVGPGANFLATPIRLYADAGQVVTAAITRFNLAPSASEAVTLVGYLVPTP